MEDRERLLERERHQIEQIRELDFEELQVEEVESLNDSDDDDHRQAVGGTHDEATLRAEFTFNTSLASLHTYLGEVEDTHNRMRFLDSGAIHQLPLFYFEGVVLFPEATLPLRVVHPNFITAIERALAQIDQGYPLTIGVVRIYQDPRSLRYKFSSVGTTAEIRQYRRLEDGSLNAVTRGQQRFRLKRCWIDAEGVACGEVQIIEEDLPQRTPRDVFDKLVLVNNPKNNNILGDASADTSHIKWPRDENEDADSEAHSEDSFESALSPHERGLHQSAIDFSNTFMDESTSSDESELLFGRSNPRTVRSRRLQDLDENHVETADFENCKIEKQCRKVARPRSQYKSPGFSYSIPRAFWPQWVYRMYDSYSLAQRAADMWRQIVGAPAMDGLVKKPDLLSFHIASKIPVSESTRQELLEIDGTSYRLRREIELLECCDRIRCKTCQTLIARRSDMLVMSSDGPLGAYVNARGHVHEVMTLHKANSLVLIGRPDKRYCWFPGYAWTIAHCAFCETQMGWLYTATNADLKPRSFWGIRSSQVADEMQ